VTQNHLPENFEAAKKLIETFNLQPSTFNLLLVSGGASVGEKDFTRALLESLGFEIVFSQINLRPGRPLIFGVNGARVAFGLPGNPLSHFVCFHFAVASALAGLTGGEPPKYLHGQLAEKLDEKPCPRETLWPAKLDIGPDATARLRPLAWANSGNVACLALANALVRVPANRGSVETGAEVDFLPLKYS
jgi:molybdopterin molybdotransferase